MSYNDILKLPYIIFVLGMLDAPQIDYDSDNKDKKKEKKKKQKGGFGTPLSQLPSDVLAQLK